MKLEAVEVRSAARGVLRGGLVPALSLAGAGVSGYLLWVRWGGPSALCTGFGGCDLVNASSYAQVGVVPVALLGLVGYLVLLGLGLWRARGGPWALSLSLFALALAGFLYSAYLTYVELFVILAVCPWCVASGLLMTGILAASWWGLEI